MLNYIDYLNIPTKIALILVGIFFALQIIGELLEFKGKAVPEILKIRKFFERKKKERIALSKITDLLDEYDTNDLLDEYRQVRKTIGNVNRLLTDIDKHYSKDNITMRDCWMNKVNEYMLENEERREKQESLILELGNKLDKNNSVTLSILIENKRSSIIDFASKVIDEGYPVTREQFNRIFKTYKEYEDIIEENHLTNGEVDIAIHIIQESYEQHMKKHTFVEDVRGYNI